MKSRVLSVLSIMRGMIYLLGTLYFVQANGSGLHNLDGLYENQWRLGQPSGAPVTEQATEAEETPSTSLTATLSNTIYLPLVVLPPAGLYGWVLEDEEPATGITVTLDFCKDYRILPMRPYNRICWDREEFTSDTDDEGMYQFLGMPTTSITQTQWYQVVWENDGDPNRLADWRTQTIYSYTLGASVNIGNFDIGNIDLVSPISGTITNFPIIFEWESRVKYPLDSYGLCLYGGSRPPPPMNWDFVGCDEPLGYVNNRAFESPFNGVDYGYDYYWYVEVWGPGGGQGESYQRNIIMFAAP